MITKLTRPRPWTLQFRRALSSPGNLIAGASALVASAVTWNPLPLILFGLGEPVWLYTATASGRYARRVRDDHRAAAQLASCRTRQWREQQLTALLETTPCGLWIRRGRLPDYAAAYRRLVAMRDQTARLVDGRDDAANALEQNIVARMDDMLCAYLMMARARLVFHCSLAKIYPQLPEVPAAATSLLDRLRDALVTAPEAMSPPLWIEDTPFVALDDALAEVRGKLATCAHRTERTPDHEDVYRPMIGALERRLAELEARGKHDLTMAAQLTLFPDQFEIILNKLATTEADIGEVVGDMKLLLEQTDDTVRFAEETRPAERVILAPN